LLGTWGLSLEFGGDAGLVRGADIVYQAEGGEDADEEVGEVEFPEAQAVACAGGEGVVVVVPSFAEAEDADQGVVAALVVAVEGA
jgi:hypothetical protein